MGVEEPEIIVFDTGREGPALTVTGAVHGNEKCGTIAIRRVLAEIEAGDIVLTRGRVTFVPVCNPLAYERDVRFVERNLNRSLFPKENPQCYEDRLGNVLCPVFEKTDVLLDIHSYHSQGSAFIFVEPAGKAEMDYAQALGITDFIHGWQESFPDEESRRAAQGTNEYTRLHGGMALTLECGNHHAPEAPDVGYDAILRALRYFDMADIQDMPPEKVPAAPVRCVRLVESVLKQDGGHFPKLWRNLDSVGAGEVMAVLKDGTEIRAPEDGYIVLPKADEVMGAEWFAFGVNSDLFADG